MPGGIVLSARSTVKITLLEVFTLSYNGWSEIEFYGVDDMELLNQLIWKKGKNDTFFGHVILCMPGFSSVFDAYVSLFLCLSPLGELGIKLNPTLIKMTLIRLVYWHFCTAQTVDIKK